MRLSPSSPWVTSKGQFGRSSYQLCFEVVALKSLVAEWETVVKRLPGTLVNDDHTVGGQQ
jgi:hypothetical protein